MSDHEERDEKVKVAYAKLESALDGALEWKDDKYCQTPLFRHLGEWMEAEKELRELHVGEGYYKSILNIIADKAVEKTAIDNRRLRKIWCLNHGCGFPSLYLDDGELQCSSCMIDFKRDSIESIMDRIQQKNLDSMTEEDHEKIRKLLGD